ncbi:hypothetical protein [Lacticaseibacillus sp. GG6-2]
MFTLAYSPLHAANPKLTRNLFAAGVAVHTKRLGARRQTWQRLGECVLAHAQWWYGQDVTAKLWLALRPQRVDAYLAAHRDEWLAQVVGMLVAFDLAEPLATTLTPEWPALDADPTPEAKRWGLEHQLPVRVSAWVFAGTLATPTGMALVQALGGKPPLPGLTEGQVARAVQVLQPPFAPLPATWRQAQDKPAPAATAAPAPAPETKLPPVAPAFVRELQQQLTQVERHGGQFVQVLPLALNLASLLGALRNHGRLQKLQLIAPRITSGGLHELAAVIDQAVVLDHAQVTIVSGQVEQTPAAAADFAELQAAGVTLATTGRRPLEARLVLLEFAQVTLAVSGSSMITAAAYHTSLELDTLIISQANPYAAWLASLMPQLKPLVPQAKQAPTRQRLLSKASDQLANFKARVAAVQDSDTHQRLAAWLYYQPQAPVAMTLGGVDYFALAFPQYDTVVVDTFTPNNALFYQHGGAVLQLATATSKQELVALGAKRAYHTDVPIRTRVRRILTQGD